MELKHIASYYPHGLTLADEDENLCTLRTLYPDCVGVEYKYNVGEYEKNFDDIKLILRNLSELTKEIEHNGEKFVPMDKIIENMNNMGCMQVVYASENKGEDYEVINIYDAETVGEDAESDPVIITQIILDNIQFTEYHIAEKLIEWKFDIFNLIGKGEAIDVNTLQTNPYK